MTREEFVENVLEIADEKPEYKLGGDGGKGVCDCVGLCIGALRRGGITYKNIHGSNWAARYESVELWEVERISDLRVGDCVLKAREPGDPKYDLPERYKNHPDQKDYYHIGVVVSVNPLKIVHMTTPTIKTDTTMGNWKYAMLWKQLQTEEEDVPMEAYRAEVVLSHPDLPNNGLVVRSDPAGDDELDKLKHGEIVTVQVVKNGWAFITQASGPSGYVTAKYLARIEDEEIPEAEGGEQPDEDETIHVQLVFTDSAGRTWVPVGDFKAELRVVND